MILSAGAGAVAIGPEVGGGLLFLEPLQKVLVAWVGLDFFDGVKIVAELVVGPGVMDEIFAGTAGGLGFASAFAAGDDVMRACGDVALAEGALVVVHCLNCCIIIAGNGCLLERGCGLRRKRRKARALQNVAEFRWLNWLPGMDLHHQ